MLKYGLIGYPLGHSFSKKFFTEKFSKEGIQHVQYELYPIASIQELPDLIRRESLNGINVTLPYKEEVLDFLDEIDSAASEIGAVNCIDISKNKDRYSLKGFNTDAFGFENSFLPNLGRHHKKALILGTGGAAKAIEFVLKKLSIECCYVSRTPKNNQLSYEAIDRSVLDEFQVIINCSPIGTYPNIAQAPSIPYKHLSESHYLYDLVYNPSETAFMQKGVQYGAIVKNGLDMLIGQAERSWEIWNA